MIVNNDYPCSSEPANVCGPCVCKGHFTHETGGPWPLHSKVSHRSKRPRMSKFHFTLQGDGLMAQWNSQGWKSLCGFLHDKLWIMFYGVWNLHRAHFQGRPDANFDTTWQFLHQIGFFISHGMAFGWESRAHKCVVTALEVCGCQVVIIVIAWPHLFVWTTSKGFLPSLVTTSGQFGVKNGPCW